MDLYFRIGGYAVIERGGNELTDWEIIKTVLPTKADATTYARRYIGAWSLSGALTEKAPQRRR